MSNPSNPLSPTRRTLILAGLALPTLASKSAWAAKGGPKVITVLGDSITAGLGLPVAQSLPAQLQIALKARKADVVVRGAGVSGDTTAGGLARVGFSVQNDTDLCIVALGGNDALQGVPPEVSRGNLDAIVKKLKARRIHVLVAGLVAPADLGGAYAREFSAIFPAVAKANKVALYPNLLDGVAFQGRLNQGDGLHPNADGARIIAERMAPAVLKAL
jgi:acyl-CoA thioesterase-1